MSNIEYETTVSRVRKDSTAEAVALAAASDAIFRGQRVKITSGYDIGGIGAFTEITIWRPKEGSSHE